MQPQSSNDEERKREESTRVLRDLLEQYEPDSLAEIEGRPAPPEPSPSEIVGLRLLHIPIALKVRSSDDMNSILQHLDSAISRDRLLDVFVTLMTLWFVQTQVSALQVVLGILTDYSMVTTCAGLRATEPMSLSDLSHLVADLRKYGHPAKSDPLLSLAQMYALAFETWLRCSC